MLFCQVVDKFNIAYAVLTRQLVVRDSTDDITPHLHGALHQLRSIGGGKNTVLRESDDLNIHEIAHFIAHFGKGLNGEQRGIRAVRMGSNKLHPLRKLPHHGLSCVTFEFFFR